MESVRELIAKIFSTPLKTALDNKLVECIQNGQAKLMGELDDAVIQHDANNLKRIFIFLYGVAVVLAAVVLFCALLSSTYCSFWNKDWLAQNPQLQQLIDKLLAFLCGAVGTHVAKLLEPTPTVKILRGSEQGLEIKGEQTAES